LCPWPSDVCSTKYRLHKFSTTITASDMVMSSIPRVSHRQGRGHAKQGAELVTRLPRIDPPITLVVGSVDNDCFCHPIYSCCHWDDRRYGNEFGESRFHVNHTRNGACSACSKQKERDPFTRLRTLLKGRIGQIVQPVTACKRVTSGWTVGHIGREGWQRLHF
jgi:hypothetical protein